MTKTQSKTLLLLGSCGLAGLAWSAPAAADATPECNVGAAADTTECGVDSVASGVNSTAVGDSATASGDNSVALGSASVASGLSAVSLGWQTVASGIASTALGHNSDATALASTAVGVSAQATATGATALGRLANAAHAGSTAIGASATTTAANQVVLGGAGTHVRIGDIAASTAAQQASSVGIATVDANGVLGRNTTVLPAIAALESSTATLFDLADRNRRDMKQGVAAAIAMAHPPIPSAPGKLSYAVNGGLFRGEYAIGGAFNYRLPGPASFSVGGGFSYGGKKNSAVRIGVAGEL